MGKLDYLHIFLRPLSLDEVVRDQAGKWLVTGSSKSREKKVLHTHKGYLGVL